MSIHPNSTTASKHNKVWRIWNTSYWYVFQTWDFIRNLPREAKWAYQRARRGWSDRDVWGLDGYLYGVLAGALLHLRDTTHGHPCLAKNACLLDSTKPDVRCNCESQWDIELTHAAGLFKELFMDGDLGCPDNYDGAVVHYGAWMDREPHIYKEAMKWLSKRMGHLWD